MITSITVSILGSRRRAQALAALGHDPLTLGAWFGCHPRYVMTCLLRGPDSRIDLELHTRITDVFERRHMDCGTCGHTRRAAVAEGWAPPMAWWDEDDADVLDDPAAVPDEIRAVDEADEVDEADQEAVVEQLLAGQFVWPQQTGAAPEWMQDARAEAIRRLTRQKLTDVQIGVRLGFADRTILRARNKYGIPTGNPGFYQAPQQQQPAA